MSVFLYVFEDSDLASRNRAARLRQHIYSQIEEGFYVVLDFNAVLSMSSGYADELIAIMACKYGDKLPNHLRLANMSENIVRSVQSAMRQRKTELVSSDPIELMCNRA